MSQKIYQYRCLVLDDYIVEFLEMSCKLMNINYNKEKFSKLFQEFYEENDPRTVCVFKDPLNESRFVMVDAGALDRTFMYLAVQCTVEENPYIKEVLEKYIRKIRRDLPPEKVIELEDVYGTKEDQYLYALKRCNVESFE